MVRTKLTRPREGDGFEGKNIQNKFVDQDEPLENRVNLYPIIRQLVLFIKVVNHEMVECRPIPFNTI